MMLKISLHRLARREFLDALSYYRDVDLPTSRRFLKLYEQALTEIAHDPTASVVIIDQIRRKLVRKFPYSIFYYQRGKTVRVIAVAHQRRRPFYWLGRD